MDLKIVHHPCFGLLSHDSLRLATTAYVFEILGLPLAATGRRWFSRNAMGLPFGGHLEMFFAIGGFQVMTTSSTWKLSRRDKGQPFLAALQLRCPIKFFHTGATLDVLNIGICGIVLVRFASNGLTSPKPRQEITTHRAFLAQRAAQRGDPRVSRLGATCHGGNRVS